MKKDSFLLIILALALAFTSCKDAGKELARTFVAAVNAQDSTRLKEMLQPRQLPWDSLAYVQINEDSLTVTETGENCYSATVGASAYFIFTDLGDGKIRVDKVKNLILSDSALLAQALQSGMLATDYDDVDAARATHRVRIENEARAQAAAARAARDARIIQKIKTLYVKYALTRDAIAFEQVASNFCTPRMQQKLRDAYEYDVEPGETPPFALWALTNAPQDGAGASRFISATAQADGWFEVKYEDMGYPGTTRVKAVEQNGRILLDDFSSPFCP